MQAANAMVLAKKEGINLAENGVKQWADEIARLNDDLARTTDPARKAAIETQIGKATTQKGLAGEKLAAMKESLGAFEAEYENLVMNVRQTTINVGILKSEWVQSKAADKLTDAAEAATKALVDIDDDIVMMQARRAQADAAAMAKLRKLNEKELSLDPLRPKATPATPTPTETVVPPTAV
jgi:hypothetical protein